MEYWWTLSFVSIFMLLLAVLQLLLLSFFLDVWQFLCCCEIVITLLVLNLISNELSVLNHPSVLKVKIAPLWITCKCLLSSQVELIETRHHRLLCLDSFSLNSCSLTDPLFSISWAEADSHKQYIALEYEDSGLYYDYICLALDLHQVLI